MEGKHIKYRLIEEVCKEKGIEKKDLSYDWISILKKGKVEKKIINAQLDLNSAVSVKLANDKYSTYTLLKYYNIPVVEHNVLFHEEIMPDYAYVNDNFGILKNEDKVVIKANDSAQGKNVFVCDKAEEKMELVRKLFEEGQEAVCICPYLEIEYEYRALYLEGEIIYIYKKQKPFVVGDGILKVEELIRRDLKYLREPMEDLDLNTIPQKGEKVVVGWKHNLSNGAIPIVIDESDWYYEQVKKIALQAGKVMELSYATIDIVVTKTGEVCVMEVNANHVVVTKFCELVPNGFEIGKEIYAKVFDKMFENS